MTRPPAVPVSAIQSANLTTDKMRRGIDRIQKRISELEALDPSTVQELWLPSANTLGTAIEETLSSVFGHGTVEYNRYKDAQNLCPNAMSFALRKQPRIQDIQGSYAKGKEASLQKLRQAIRGLEEEIADQEHHEVPVSTAELAPVANSRKVFVVHGHDEAARLSVARFLEKIGLEAIILSEQPDQGRTIIEKFEECVADVGFAVVLLTPDDLGGVATAPVTGSRARQNVIFELGYFAGKLGRGRACLMRKGAVEIPSDLHGVIYTDMDAADGWQIKLVKELKAANLDFDANRAWG
ncbi:MAG TPA: nucleotide-binding protein [Aliidongia sp.]|nr:nucleotide-binding protein [Aliidongia sp.]